MSKSSNRTAAMRARREKAGWVQLNVWCHHTDKERVNAYIRRLRRRAEQKWGAP